MRRSSVPMDASIKALKDEEQRLSGRRKALEERQKWLKDTLEANMRYTGKMKFKTPLFSFSIQKNGGLEPLVITGELEDIPGRYLIQQPPIPDNMKIRKLLEEQPVEWAHLEPRGESPEDPLMDRESIGPFRMQLLMEVAAKAVKIMTTGVWHLSFDEMDIVLEYIRYGIDAYKRKYEEGNDDVSENR